MRLGAVALMALVFGAPAHGEGCGPAAARVRVAAVLDDFDLALDDGRELRLAGIEPARATPTEPALGEETRVKLSAWLSGRELSVAPLAATDRWDRVPALAWVSEPADGTSGSVAEAILSAGWGRVRPEPELAHCFAAFRGLEETARKRGLGLWGDPYYAVVDGGDAAGLTARAGSLALVEGRLHFGSGRNRTVLRLGEGASGFTATLSRRAAKLLGAAGIDLAALAGRRVRIRGFLDDRFGPRIDVISADQIEDLGPAGPNGGSDEPGARK